MLAHPFLIRVYLCLSVAFLPACGPKNFENDNDLLRAERLELQREVARLQEQVELREAQLAAAHQQLDGDTHPVEGARPPQLAKLKLDRYTSAVDTDRDGRDDLVRVYLRTLDGRGRFLPVAGRATLQVVNIREGEEPLVLAERTYPPGEFEETYRSTVTGTHYTLEVPLPDNLPDDIEDAAAKVTFTEGVTGAEFTEQTAVLLNRP